MLSTVVFENKTGEPVHYVDEWMQLVASGTVKPSETDEVNETEEVTTPEPETEVTNSGEESFEEGIRRYWANRQFFE